MPGLNCIRLQAPRKCDFHRLFIAAGLNADGTHIPEFVSGGNAVN
jgi:hypothetical protein